MNPSVEMIHSTGSITRWKKIGSCAQRQSYREFSLASSDADFDLSYPIVRDKDMD